MDRKERQEYDLANAKTAGCMLLGAAALFVLIIILAAIFAY